MPTTPDAILAAVAAAPGARRRGPPPCGAPRARGTAAPEALFLGRDPTSGVAAAPSSAAAALEGLRTSRSSRARSMELMQYVGRTVPSEGGAAGGPRVGGAASPTIDRSARAAWNAATRRSVAAPAAAAARARRGRGAGGGLARRGCRTPPRDASCCRAAAQPRLAPRRQRAQLRQAREDARAHPAPRARARPPRLYLVDGAARPPAATRRSFICEGRRPAFGTLGAPDEPAAVAIGVTARLRLRLA